jgi:hypothetical protein
MKPEQLNWTDGQWAAHLGCAVQRVPYIRNIICENFSRELGKIKKMVLFHFL